MNPMQMFQQTMAQAQQEMQRKNFQGAPTDTMNAMYQQNPQAASKVQEALQSGKSPQQLAMEIMQQRGLNPSQFGIPSGFPMNFPGNIPKR